MTTIVNRTKVNATITIAIEQFKALFYYSIEQNNKTVYEAKACFDTIEDAVKAGRTFLKSVKGNKWYDDDSDDYDDDSDDNDDEE